MEHQEIRMYLGGGVDGKGLTLRTFWIAEKQMLSAGDSHEQVFYAVDSRSLWGDKH